ncbi:MAG: hypothetical protein B7Z60_07905 [Ferrovum sp. 37-45-19]|nr:MAG: hypothetical protein B7Z65_07640 [Ferrovum sp. 21-44-67]OYV93700.1 MAG: hypothetical protein B7Z60_07905 [Ferrovum sp. 37-45-19]OZB31677.1 MAG: hypothetical protein B7X47_09170 [Ferrovum sp. 34-44-207]HQT82454.1 proton-conducting transporter membrane subunit [Ferrovaceae bacterium]HQU07201.1 proton-conducting transporter membrane subunit [Ferrovaceae bacterium]
MLLSLILLLHLSTLFLSYGKEYWIKKIPVMLFLACVLVGIFLCQAIIYHELDAILSLSLLASVELLSIVIFSFAYDYLSGERRRTVFLRLLLTLASCVALLLLCQSIILLFLSWCVMGFVVNQLLLFYRDRTHTHAIANKQLVNDTLANILMGSGLLGLALQGGSFSIALLSQRLLTSPHHYSTLLFLLLIVTAFMLKAAIMPFHGWLIQVMEVPTPVSAFMHAGIVNLSGMMWLRLYPWWTHYPEVREWLMIMALMSLILSSMVMLTRVSIKVRLAWSTTAQMSVVFIECAQGWYEMALIHIIGHSLYKAQAFLLSGSRVAEQPIKEEIKGMLGSVSPNCLSPVLSALVSLSLFVAIEQLLAIWVNTSSLLGQQTFFISLLLSPMLWLLTKETLLSLLIRVVVLSVTMVILILSHTWLNSLFPQIVELSGGVNRVIMATLLITYLLHFLILSGQLGSRFPLLNTWAFEGFYLDALWSNYVVQALVGLTEKFKTLFTNAVTRTLHDTP